MHAQYTQSVEEGNTNKKRAYVFFGVIGFLISLAVTGYLVVRSEQATGTIARLVVLVDDLSAFLQRDRKADVFSSDSGSTFQATPTSQAGPIGSWSFDKEKGITFYDSSGNKNDANPKGVIDRPKGVINQSAAFDGKKESYLEILPNKPLTIPVFTLDFWLYINSYPLEVANILEIRGEPGSECSGLCSTLNLQVDKSGKLSLVRASIWGSKRKTWSCTSDTCVLPAESWINVGVAQAVDEKVTFYFNGNPVYTNVTPVKLGDGPVFYPVSGLGGKVGQNLIGMIDEMKLFDRALSHEELFDMFAEVSRRTDQKIVSRLANKTADWVRVEKNDYTGLNCSQYCSTIGKSCSIDKCSKGPDACDCSGGLCRIENWGSGVVCNDNSGDMNCNASIGSSPSVYNFYCCCG